MKASAFSSVLVVLVGSFAACVATAPEGPAPLTEPTSKSRDAGKSKGDDDDFDGATVIVPPVDAATGGDTATTYHGTLAQTPTTRFGGVSPHCTYDVFLSNVEIEVTVLPSGEVISGQAKDLMVEKIVGTCPYVAQPSSQQSFSFATATGTTVTWVGGTNNHPATKLTVILTKTGASYEAEATWERTDLTGDLKWVVKTKTTLGPQ